MKKIFLFLVLSFFLSIPALAQEKEAKTIDSYQPILWVFGKENCVYQVSFKYNVWQGSGIYFAYTQKSLWRIYDNSSPFEENNYNPSIFWEKQKPFKFFDFLRIIPYEHKSNGLGGQDSRGTDRGFVEIQASYGSCLNIGVREKAGPFYVVSNHNKDIKRYIGYFETELFIQLKGKGNYTDQEKLYIKGEWTHRFYWFEAGFMFRILTPMVQPKLFVAWNQGYGEFLHEYNVYHKTIRGGIIFPIE